MAENFRTSLKESFLSFGNVLGKLLRTHPIVFLTFMALIAYGLIMFTRSEKSMTFALCILISFVTILIFINKRSYSEAVLSFMLGMLTIFTIKWDGYSSKLFIGFYIIVNVFIFLINSVRLSMKVESDLKTASSIIDLNDSNTIYFKLNKIVKKNTNFNILSSIDKAEVIRYLAYMKVPIEDIENSIKNIELIKIIYQLDISKSCEFFKTLQFLKYRSINEFDIGNMLDIIVAKRLPLLPEEFLMILNKTKFVIINNKYSMIDYLEIIESSVEEGMDLDEIVYKLKNG